MIKMIAAMSMNDIIGLKGDSSLLWSCKQDMVFFKKYTIGGTVVMGNNTFKSMGSKPLPNRTNVVVSKKEAPGERNGVTYIQNPNEAIIQFKEFVVIGGEQIYNHFIDLADEVLLTSIGIMVNLEDPSQAATFPVDRLEEDYHIVYQSAVIPDIDRVSGNPTDLIVSRWVRDITRLH